LLIALLPFALSALQDARAAPVSRVDSIGITVSDMDRALAFYTGVLPFEVVSEVEVQGDAYEHLFGVFGMRARIVRLRLGDEQIELIDYLAPEGRPVPVDSRSNDEWFQHIAIIVSDMDAAYARLRQHKVPHASTGPPTLPDWNPKAGGIKAFYFKDPDGHNLEILQFPPDKAPPGGTSRATRCSAASITPRSWCATPRRASASSRMRSASRSAAPPRTTGSSRNASTTSSAPAF
jgi:catechol 2,3-dioxygenase-like lactoylglutathione lyase family enzyme